MSGFVQKNIRRSTINGRISEMKTVEKQGDPGYAVLHLLDVSIGSVGKAAQLKIEIMQGWESKSSLPDIRDRVKHVINLSRNSSATKYMPNNQGAGTPFKQETGMSLHAKENCYLIFRVSGASGLRFSVDHFGFSYDRDIAKHPFQFVRRITDSGDILEDVEDPSKEAWPSDCRMLLVALDKSQIPTTKGHGAALFNLHLDVLSDITKQDGPYIPIIVDPDVRFPGGNSPGGG